MPAKDQSDQERAVERRPGRVRSAWLALMGHPVIPASIRAEWAETQLVIHDMLAQLSTSLARQAKAEKRRIERLREASQAASQSPDVRTPPPMDSGDRKAALRRFAFHGGERPDFLRNGSQRDLPFPHQNGDDNP